MNTYLYHLFLLSFSLSIHCQFLEIEPCQCLNLKTQYDCEQNKSCQWNSACQLMEEKQTDEPKPESLYCKDLPQEVCRNKRGCAYWNNGCIHFSGCTSYVKTTHNECQLISVQCTSDGIQCILPRECSKNQNEQLCGSVISSSGSKKCFWQNNKCLDQTCDDAPKTFNTDQDCDNFIKGCITNNKGCTAQLKNCYNYDKDCDNMIGSDGLCESKNDKCQSKDCTNAPSTYYTDVQCQQFRKGCRTTGIGCTDKVLKSCTTYTGDSETCLKYIGSSGKCEKGQNDKCQARKCENAPKQYQTDEDCKSYSSICKTTGVGCVAILLYCNSYNGTKSECEKRIGADGRCTGTEEAKQCKVKICSDAQYSTDSECQQYQYHCITNGIECTLSLNNCNNYKGDVQKCNKYIGIDGKCTVGENGYCAVNYCENAYLKTNEECKTVQSYCLTNGTKCVRADTCSNTIQKLTCDAIDTCQWTEQCVTNQCKYFPTKGMCLRHSSNSECFWDNYMCVNKQCKHADKKYRTNQDCQNFISHCVTNGQGCVDVSDPCEEYIGDEDTCTKYKGNNNKIPCVYDPTTSKCRSKTCYDNQSAQNQQDCDKTLEGCKFKGTLGCVNENAECSEFYGNTQECYSLNKNCSQDQGVIGYCRPLECYDNQSALEDYYCNLFKSGCVTKGVGCIASTAPCSQYTGNSIADCSKFVGNGKKCWYDQGFPSQCVDKQCSHNVDAQDDNECEKFLTGCVFNKKGCQDPNLSCDTYEGDEYQCSKYKGNGLQCIRIDYCEDRNCSDIQNPKSLQECEQYLSKCAFDGYNCIDKDSCVTYSGKSKEQCEKLVNLHNDFCIYDEKTNACTDRKCNEATNVHSQKDCTSYRQNCIYTGNDKCVELQLSCDNYKEFSEQGCKDAINQSGNGCWFGKDGNCIERTCSEPLEKYSIEICQQHHSTCIYSGIKCILKKETCTAYQGLSQSECRYLPNCWKQEDDDTPCQDKQCSDSVESPSDQNCRNHLSQCRFDGDNKCVDEQDECNGYKDFSVDACRQVTTKNGEKCWLNHFNVICQKRTCDDKLQQYSAEDCVNHLSTCRYDGIICQDAKDMCSQYIGFSNAACSQITTKTNQSCWYAIKSTICVDPTCNDDIMNASAENCQKHLPNCRFNGTRCIYGRDNCKDYMGSDQVCSMVSDLKNNQCWYDISNTSEVTSGIYHNCIQKECSNKQIIYNSDVCQKYFVVKGTPRCTYDGIKCINIKNKCSDYIGYNSQQCLLVTTLSGEICFQDKNNSSMICRSRQCSDNDTAINDMQCDQFLKGCKTNGKGCIDQTQKCQQYIGTQSSCLNFTGNGKKCKGLDIRKQCSVRQCYHDQQSITDVECNSFMEGCVTNGKGCISSSEPCSSYIGNREICSKFKGNGKYCYSDNLVDSFSLCRDKLCTDMLLANQPKGFSNAECKQFMPGCVSKGIRCVDNSKPCAGCIDESEPCSNYFGTQTQCSQFIGEYRKKPCWNVSDATQDTRCINRECIHKQRSSNNLECQLFLDGCVSDGFQCVKKQYCSQFVGTVKTCMLYDAIDRPCKGIGRTIQQCQQLQCIDAPNNYDTNDKCNQFKNGCVTTGFGCVDQHLNTCEMVSSKQLCKERPDCQYIDGCFNQIKLCMQITKYSQCLNNMNRKCSWDFSTKSCREWNCTDASILLQTHEQCQALNSDCTTTGNGCINISPCSEYKNKQTCYNAVSNGYTKKCLWKKNACTEKVCEDAPMEYNDDSLCKQISQECVTIGQGCIYKQYTCENINLKTKCNQDSNGNPCLWMNLTQTCIKFSQCTDIVKTTPEECLLYSDMCISNGKHCISISQCSDYTNQVSCYKGYDGNCGWVVENNTQEPNCQLFKRCADIPGKTKENCQLYSKTCTSDGQNCMEIGACDQYITQYGCENDNTCFWDNSQDNPFCRQYECTDIPVISYMSYSYCSTFSSKLQLKCTTEENQCIEFKKCSEYFEQSCYQGTDGLCIYAFPLNQVSGTKQCRVKDCVDYIGFTTEECSKLKSGCISDGSRCLSKLNCVEYKSQIACDSDGIDGVCVFDKNKTCQLMTKCEDAKNNPIACSKKANVCLLQYEQNQNNTTNTTNTTSSQCIQRDCNNSPDCSPLLNFNETYFTVCIQKSEKECIQGQPEQLSQSRCYLNTLYTYSWNNDTKTCEKCLKPLNISQPNKTEFQKQLCSIILILIIIAI